MIFEDANVDISQVLIGKHRVLTCKRWYFLRFNRKTQGLEMQMLIFPGLIGKHGF